MPSTNTVLVIEDNIVNRKVLYKILEDEYNVLEAKNGEEGLAMLQANPQTAAVILDLVMPIMDGFAFMSKI
ncbi:MAG: response regulator, partial [Eubacterium sp.]